MNAEKRKLLKDELATLQEWKADYVKATRKKYPEPAAVRTARRVVARFENMRSRYTARLRKKYSDDWYKVRAIILFGTEKEALAAVEKLRQKFKRLNAGKIQ